MFFTAIRLNPSRQLTRQMLASPQKAHSTVLDSFPQNQETSSDRVLWRIDRSNRHDITLLIVSREKAVPLHIVESAGWDNGHEGYKTFDYSAVFENIKEGDRFSFRLKANPTRNTNGRRIGITGEVEQMQWLESRAESVGFKVGASDFRITSSDDLKFTKKGGTVTLRSVQYDGVLVVSDPVQFAALLSDGIGRGKAYGHGMLTIAKSGSVS